MQTETKMKTTAGSRQQICRRKIGKLRCKNVSGDNEFQYCENHLRELTDFLTKKTSKKKKLLPPDELRCCERNLRLHWRCKNFRMMTTVGAVAGDDTTTVPTSNYCQKHYKAVTDLENGKETKKKKLPQDLQLCCLDKCMNLRMNVGADVDITLPNTKFCGEHYFDYLESKEKGKKRSRYGEGAGSNTQSTRRKKGDGTGIQPSTNARATCDRIIENGSTDIWVKKVNVERPEWPGKLESMTRIQEPQSGESRISNLESLVLRSANKSSEKFESEASDLLNDVTQSSEKQSEDNNMNNSYAETSSGGRTDSNVHEMKSKNNVYDVGVSKHHESVAEFSQYSAIKISSGSQHGSLYQDQLELSWKPFVNLVSDDDSESEDSDTSTDSGGSFGELMKIMAMKYRNEYKDKEIKWNSEADMLLSFEEDPELCMKAVCALYRKQISRDDTSDKALFYYFDLPRATNLAKFLMDGACQGDLKKSVNELELLDSEAVEDCKRLARRYSKQLFRIYLNGKDPFFLPATSNK